MAVIPKNYLTRLILYSNVKKDMTQEQIQQLNESFISIICDEGNLKILQSTMGTKKIPSQIKKETGLPQTTCYRKIKELTKLGLLRKVGYNLTEARHREYHYRSVSEHIELFVKDSKLTVAIH